MTRSFADAIEAAYWGPSGLRRLFGAWKSGTLRRTVAQELYFQAIGDNE